MLSRHHSFGRPVLAVLAFVSLLRQVSALTVKYCSSQNTGLGDPTFWKYQSNGWCHDYCVDHYAFAILQDANCWCSDYAPGVTEPSNNCNTPCPGYGSENCGGSGLFVYIALGKSPSGTSGAPSDTTVQQVTVTAIGAPITVFSTVTPPPPPSTASSSSLVPSTSSTFVSASDTSSPDPRNTATGYSHTITWVPTPVTSVETETGQVRTVTITPTSPATANQNVTSIEQPVPSKGLNSGQAVGLTIGLVIIVAIIGAIIFFIMRKRRRDASNGEFDRALRGDGSSDPSPHRAMSQNSRYMLGTDGKQVVEGWEPEIEAPGKRRSRLMPVDPRLDPFASVYQRGDGSVSRESMVTVRDDHDYSRRIHSGGRILRATNPDE